MARFENIRWITFDASDTLIFPHPSVGEVYAGVMAGRGLQAPPMEMEKRFVQAFRDLTSKPRPQTNERTEVVFWRTLVRQTVSPWCPEDKIEDVFQDAFRAFGSAKAWRTAGDAAAVLGELKGRGYRLAVLSNADGRFHTVFRELELADFFEHIFLSAELEFEKPDPRVFTHVQSALGAEPAEILHVGDSPRNDGAARQAGWHAAILGHDIGSLSELPALLS